MSAAERMQALKEKVERQTRGQSWTARRSSSVVVQAIAADVRALKNDPNGLEEYAGMLEQNHAGLADLGTLNPDAEARRTESEQAAAKLQRDKNTVLDKIAADKLAADKAAGKA